MKPSTTVDRLALALSWLAATVIVVLPFHAFLTVWLSSAVDNYTLLRLWKEFLLLIISLGAAYILLADKKLRRSLFAATLTKALALYLLLSVTWGAAAYLLDKVTLKALSYGLTVNLRFLIFFFALWIIATKSQWLQKVWPKLLFIPAAIVVVIALLQRLVLPYDVLRHFGYNRQTIFPYQTINYDINYPRVMSTLRGANPLGTYLILVLSALAVVFLKFKRHRWLWGVFAVTAGLALLFSYSRGAWAGLGLSGLFLAWLALKRPGSKRVLLAVLSTLLVVATATAFVLRDNATFENYLFHTNDFSKIEESSNEAHISAFRGGLDDIVTEPLGRGVGTAGPASVYNDGQARLAENYFIQIAQEVGWLGLAVFIAINFLVVRQLWSRKTDSLTRLLLVSFVGITAVNLVSHAWTDDTLAYIWWGLAGIALANSRR